MDPIDQRARTARMAVEDATAEVTPGPFAPRRSRVAPAVMAASLLVGGSVLATSVLGDSDNGDQQVSTEADMAASADEATAASDVAPATIPDVGASTAAAASDEPMEETNGAEELAEFEGDFFVLDAPPPGLGAPVIFAIPETDMPDVPFELMIDVYGTPGAEDTFVNGDIGIMRAEGMGRDGIEGEPVTVAGREVLVDRNEAPGPDSPPDGPSIIVNWIDEDTGMAVGVATWSLELDVLLPLVEVLLDDPTASPADAGNGLLLVSSSEGLGAGIGLMSGRGNQVMYQADPTTVQNDNFGFLVVSSGDAEENPNVASSWLFSGTVPQVSLLADGVTVVELDQGVDGTSATSVRVPDPSDLGRVIIVEDMGSGAYDRDTLIAVARSARLATEAEVAEMGAASDQMGLGGPIEPSVMIEGEYPNGERVLVESGPEGFCIFRNGEASPEGCYDVVPQANTGEMFVLTTRSAEGDVLILPFAEPAFESGPVDAEPVAAVELRMADGSVVTGLEFAPTGEMAQWMKDGFGWSAELDEMPIAAVGVAADGSDIVSYTLPDIEPKPGRKVTFIGMS